MFRLITVAWAIACAGLVAGGVAASTVLFFTTATWLLYGLASWIAVGFGASHSPDWSRIAAAVLVPLVLGLAVARYEAWAAEREYAAASQREAAQAMAAAELEQREWLARKRRTLEREQARDREALLERQGAAHAYEDTLRALKDAHAQAVAEEIARAQPIQRTASRAEPVTTLGTVPQVSATAAPEVAPVPLPEIDPALLALYRNAPDPVWCARNHDEVFGDENYVQREMQLGCVLSRSSAGFERDEQE